ncbi:MAG TPA: hypothetical protein VEK08_12200 [Planctomycetota bacterium]|nr:hypothetical protein [Planctomycetota bacterium]
MNAKKIVALAVLFLVSSVVSAATFKPDDEGFIRNWLLLEPIQLDEKASSHDEDNQKDFFNKEWFPGMKTAAPKDGDKVKVEGKELKFSAKQADDSIISFPEQDNSLYIGVTYIVADADIADVKLKIGSDDSSIWILNGKEILRVFAGRGVEKDQDTSTAVTLAKGTNTLVCAVINGGGPTGMCARFVDKNDSPLKNISISLTK